METYRGYITRSHETITLETRTNVSHEKINHSWKASSIRDDPYVICQVSTFSGMIERKLTMEKKGNRYFLKQTRVRSMDATLTRYSQRYNSILYLCASPRASYLLASMHPLRVPVICFRAFPRSSFTCFCASPRDSYLPAFVHPLRICVYFFPCIPTGFRSFTHVNNCLRTDSLS